MKIYFDLFIQFDRFKELLFLSLQKNLMSNVTITNNIRECDLIILLLNSSKSLINLHTTNKNKDKLKAGYYKNIKPKEKNQLNMLYSSKNDNIDRINYFKMNKPIILIERLDSSITWIREFDKYPNVIGIIKNRIAHDMNINNNELYTGRHHGLLITQSLKKEELTPICNKKPDIGINYYKGACKLKKLPKEYFDKFHAILWDFHSSPLSNKMNFFIENKDFNKDNDVFCVHSLRGGIIAHHRKKAINIIKDITKIKTFTDNCDEKKYNNMFIKSKICVACWGFGEWTHMDGYAMYSKTILIKPNNDFVKMDPDIYNSKRYIPCKPDFSDLEDKINEILENYDEYNDMLEDNRKFIMSLNKKQCCKNFWKKIEEIYLNFK